jgi:hypothetical protein
MAGGKIPETVEDMAAMKRVAEEVSAAARAAARAQRQAEAPAPEPGEM